MALTAWSRTAASNTNAATGINFDEDQLPSTVNNAAREMESQLVIGIQDSTLLYLTSVSGTNTILATAAASMTAYATGQRFHFIPANTNTGATTININSIGAKNIFYYGSACTGNEIIANVPCTVIYDGTQFNLVNAVGRATTDTLTNKTLTSPTLTTPTINSATFTGPLAGTTIVVKRKTADESVTSSTTLQNDDHLTFSVAANEEWTASFSIDGGDNLVSTGLRFSVTVPAGATLDARASCSQTDSFSSLGGVSTASGGFIFDTTAMGGTKFHLSGSLWVLNGANAGSVTIQWAQGVSSGTALTFKKGSSLVAFRIA